MYIKKHAIVIVFLLIPRICFSTIIHVPADEPTIQSGINAAGDGDTILIADGIYKGFGNYNITWNAAYKHLVIMSVNGPTNCIIDCQGNGRGFILNWEHNSNDVINGLTITNGWANTYLVGGGAILIKSASPQIINCILVDNSAGDDYNLADGGAIDCIKKSSPIIKGNIIRNNSATHTGGGIHFADSSSGVIENNIIDNNKSGGCYGGGGIALVGLSNPLIINNLIINNSSWYYSEGGYGGGIITMNSDPMIINNTIANNTTLNGSKLGEGGGIRVRGKPYPIIKNCILWNNLARDTLENIDFQYPSESLDISYCNIEGGLYYINAPEASTNFNSLPFFIDPGNDNYQLQNTSSCINKGDPDTSGLSLPSHDLSGNPRIVDGRIDVGAYEYNQEMATSVITDPGNSILYPNPNSGEMIIKLIEDEDHENPVVKVYNLRGELVYIEKVNGRGENIQLNINYQPGGIFIVVIISGKQVLSRKKIIIE